MTDLLTLIDKFEKAEADKIQDMNEHWRQRYREFVERVNRTTDREIADAALLKALRAKEQSR